MRITEKNHTDPDVIELNMQIKLLNLSNCNTNQIHNITLSQNTLNSAAIIFIGRNSVLSSCVFLFVSLFDSVFSVTLSIFRMKFFFLRFYLIPCAFNRTFNLCVFVSFSFFFFSSSITQFMALHHAFCCFSSLQNDCVYIDRS